MIETVFFDLGDTLIYMDPLPEEVFASLCREEGIAVEPEAVRRAYGKADLFYFANMLAYRGRMERLWLEYDGIVLQELGISDPGRRLARAISEGFREGQFWHLFPETEEVLVELRREGYKLGIISNADEDVERILSWLGLLEYVDTITYSQEVGVEKPDPRIFQIALQRTGSNPREALHVGDRYDADIVGARAAGIAPVLIDREEDHRDPDCPRIRSLEELWGILRA
ncbi:MAG: HAD family hydrolase [Candidatus Bipolaricaulia bacterium]